VSTVHGRVHVVTHYAALVDVRGLPFGEQDVFEAAFQAFIARARPPLTEQEEQLARAAARWGWRAGTDAWAAVRAAEVRRGMGESPETLRDARIEGAGRS
jgi:hypothetical protein